MSNQVLIIPPSHTSQREVFMPQIRNVAQSTSETPAAGSGQKPVEKFRDGPVHVSIWENEGAKGAFRTASFELRYRDGEDQWQSGRSYTSSNLLHLESAARCGCAPPPAESW